MTEQLFAIQSTGQLTYDDLKIGAGNFWEEDYPNENGETQHGLICHLWFFVRNRSELDRMARVYPGTVEEVGGYRVEVKSVQHEGNKDFVILSVAKTNPR